MKEKILLNEKIEAEELRVIDADGAQLGIMSRSDALALAQERGVDLVLMPSTAVPQIAKLLDAGKYLFELSKKEKANKKNSKSIVVKEIKLTCVIDRHDMETKAKNAIRMLKNGDKVRVSLFFRGREISNVNYGKSVLNNFVELCGGFAKIDKPMTLNGHVLSIVLAPTSTTNGGK